MDKIATAVNAASQYLTDHPSEARYTDSVATATVEDGLRVAVRGPAGEELTTDMVAAVGGADSAPSPGWFLRAAEAACVATLAAMRAAQLGIDAGSIEVAVDSESDDRGILGLAADVPAGPLSTSIRIRFDGSPSDRPTLEALASWAVEHCPVVDAVMRAVPVVVDVSVSG
jgi:uncharacterized OsmC-like protein